MATLREMKDDGWSITLYCLSMAGPVCHHSWRPSWEQLIQYFGQEFVLSGDREPFARLVCEVCGGRGASVIVLPPEPVGHRASGGHRNSVTAMTVEQSVESYRAFMADFRRQGLKTIAEMNAESRAKLKRDKAAKTGGAGFIGPPSPFAHRKKRRSV